jgi:thiamine pyrophosphate-dependent acetolactate synthase large subunit-like protein
MTGLIGFSSGYHAMLSCDLLLMLGTDFPYRNFYPKDVTVAQVDHRPAVLGRRTRIDLGIVGDVKETILALLPRLTARRIGVFSNVLGVTTPTRARISTYLRNRAPASAFIRSTSRASSIASRQTMRSSPRTSEPRWSGRRGI